MNRLLTGVLGLLLCVPAFADPSFSLSGRISIRHHDEAYHGTLNWQHTAATDELALAGPLGQGAAELRRDESGVVLLTPNGERHQAATLDALADRLFGAPLPISALPNWIRGIAPNAHLDEKQRPVRLVLPDWTVEWLRYDEAGRPQLLSLEGADVGVRLRIDTWTEDTSMPGSLP